MEKMKFLLLDAGPIIKLFELGIWKDFIKRCEVTICRTVTEEAKWASREFEDIHINLDSYENDPNVHIKDIEISEVQGFYNKFNSTYKERIHDGEMETLALLHNSTEPWRLCAADRAVFRVLGLLGAGEKGISLEEVLKAIGLSRSLPKHFTKEFRERWTQKGKIDLIQKRGLD